MQGTEHSKTTLDRFVKCLFYGNYFYGICSVSIMIETVFQMNIPYNGISIYLLAFTATILFYNYPYARIHHANKNNPRSQWYIRNHHLVMKMQMVLTVLLLAMVAHTLIANYSAIKKMNWQHWLLLFCFPVAGAFYYGVNLISAKYNIRKYGWLKPFIIGFVWAGVGTVYPSLFNDIVRSVNLKITLFQTLLFLKNFMFISLLAIMFDIKDFADDSNARLGTFVVKIGLRRTIFYVLLPLTVLGIFTFLCYALTHYFSILKMLLVVMPFVLLIAVAVSLRKRRKLLYYLIIIDGLMIVKAAFGIWAVFF